MSKTVLLMIIITVFISCGKKLSVEETVRQCKVCESSGMFSEVHYNFWGNNIISVTCGTTLYKSETQHAAVNQIEKDTTHSVEE